MRKMNTKQMIKKYEEKGYTMKDLQEHYQEEKEFMTYPDWVKMMKQVVDQMPVKTW